VIDIYRQARLRRDRNFDGVFFFGVRTTGIFCRPSCPSPTAKETHVRYFQSVYAAMESGLRPCLRCRPDVSLPWDRGSVEGPDVVAAALEMMHSGYLNYHSIIEMARELLISDRHLRQLFIDHLGIPPVRVLRHHRALFAKKLLLSSQRSVTEIAYASGFGSLRQFHSVFRQAFGVTPTKMRRQHGAPPAGSALLLKYNAPFDFAQMLAFMRPRALAGVEVITDSSYSRTFRTPEASGYFTVRDCPARSALALEIHSDDIKCYMAVSGRVRRMFDLDRDFTEINRRFLSDPHLAPGMKNGHVPRLPVAFNPFAFAVRAVLGQQISVKAATTLAARVAARAGEKTDETFPQGLDLFFPTPEALLDASLADLGLTGRRQATLKDVAEAVLSRRVSLNANQSFEAFHRAFIALKGIGDWTVHYVGMRGLGLMDCFPASDLGVVKALSPEGERLSSTRDIVERAAAWRPYRSYATLCLWNRS